MSNNWISVNDRFPDKYGRYLVYEPEIGVYIAFVCLCNGKYFWLKTSLEERKVTHWMELPKPPED